MAVEFRGDTWLYVQAEIEKSIRNKTNVCITTGKTHEEIVAAQGAIEALKSILNLPQVYDTLAATKPRQ